MTLFERHKKERAEKEALDLKLHRERIEQIERSIKKKQALAAALSNEELIMRGLAFLMSKDGYIPCDDSAFYVRNELLNRSKL